MSDLSDTNDRGSEREAEMRGDALGEISRHIAEQAAQASARFCRLCDEPIPLARRRAVPGVQTCVDCQIDIERALAMRGL